MTYVNDKGYVERTTGGRRGVNGAKRDWWLVKRAGKGGYTAMVQLGKWGHVVFPKSFLGKRVRFKIEII